MRTAKLLLHQRRPVVRIHAVRREDAVFVRTVCSVLSGKEHAAIGEGEPDCPDCLRKIERRHAPARQHPELAARIEEKALGLKASLHAQGRAAWIAGLPWSAAPAQGRRAWEDGWIEAALETLQAAKREAAGVV